MMQQVGKLKPFRAAEFPRVFWIVPSEAIVDAHLKPTDLTAFGGAVVELPDGSKARCREVVYQGTDTQGAHYMGFVIAIFGIREKEQLTNMATDKTFTIVTDDTDDNFFIEAPDGEVGDWAEPGEVATVDYDGRLYLATDCDDFPGMAAGVVYSIGAAQTTEESDLDAWEGGEGEGEDDETEEDEDEVVGAS